MPEPLKNMLNQELLQTVASDIRSVYHPFQADEFLKSTMDETWGDLELKDRMNKIGIFPLLPWRDILHMHLRKQQ